MAIVKLPSENWQVKLRGRDGKWVTKAFTDLKSAKQFEAIQRNQILCGSALSGGNVSIQEYFSAWFEQVKGTGSPSWRHEQLRRYERYIQPVLGARKIRDVTPAMIGSILNGARDAGLTEQTCLHIYCLLHKMFEDAVELFRCLSFNPVIRTLRPKPPQKEARHLTIDQAVKLLTHVEGKPYELAIWLGLYVGLRVGEIQALRWDNVDLEKGVVHVRATFVRKEDRVKDYPKGRKWHSHQMPPELVEKLRVAKETALQEFVVASPRRSMLNYEGFRGALKRYCREAGIPIVIAHGLRHSTAAIYMANGATRDDLRKLFRHSASSVTDRYVHDTGERVDGIARVIQLLPKTKAKSVESTNESGCSMNVPREVEIALEQSS